MKKKNILLKSAMGVGSIAAISTVAVAATSCSSPTPTPTAYIQATTTGTLSAGVQSTTVIQINAVEVTVPSANTTVDTEDLPNNITAKWNSNGNITLTGNNTLEPDTIVFTISIGDVSTEASVTIIPNIPNDNVSLDTDKFYWSDSVGGSVRYIYGEDEDPSEDWIVTYSNGDVEYIALQYAYAAPYQAWYNFTIYVKDINSVMDNVDAWLEELGSLGVTEQDLKELSQGHLAWTSQDGENYTFLINFAVLNNFDDCANTINSLN